MRLETLAADVVEPPVRLVKTIGDAAMLASPRARAAAGRGARAVDAADAEGEEFPQLRAGAALGLALPRAGDWFGRPVNLASRITSVARPGSLLVERELRESPSRVPTAGPSRASGACAGSASPCACSARAVDAGELTQRLGERRGVG